ncbi:scarecrow-like protein 33 [Panicum virgatum]|uniref:scarecrow-like protein 33 n=1 Tax=Panicum virgatum TaxID=38727 RepID=UPI0019D5CE67|nr:scarecrow-like protein 33 [Panicum virgatum]
MIKDPEENCANEMLDEMILHAYDTCIKGMRKLHVSMDTKVDKGNRKKYNKAAKNNMVDIHTLLISCAQAVATNNHMRARELLMEIKQHASATGDATQRVALCFTKGLEARLVGAGSQLWQLLMAEHPSIVEFLKAYRLYYAVCCFKKVALSFSTMTILQAMVGKRKLHIVDYGMHFGFQWAGLLRLLAGREGGPPEVKITAIGPAKLKACPAERIEELGCRLSNWANEFGLASFKFHTIMKKWEDVRIEDLNTNTDEVIVVNDLFSFSTLMDESVFFDRQSPRDTVLSNIKKMRPDVFIQSILNCSCGSSFVARFREVMSYYMALFDILDATMPRESKSRVVLEQFVLGRPALNIIACEGLDLAQRPEKYRQWQFVVTMENHRRSNMPCMCTQRQYTRAVAQRRRRRSPGGRMLQCPPGLTGASRRSAACGGDGIHAIQGLDSAKANQSGPLASPINLITFFSASSVLGYS